MEARLKLTPEGQPGQRQPSGAPVHFSALNVMLQAGLHLLEEFMHKPENKKSMVMLKNGLNHLYDSLSPSAREALDESFKPIGFIPFITNSGQEHHTWAASLAGVLSGLLVSSHQLTGGSCTAESCDKPTALDEDTRQKKVGGRNYKARGCGCGQDRCDKGAGSKMSKAFLAKVRALL